MTTNRCFIEETFPVKEVSIESAREKNIRHGHISTLHIWWARRPLASSRATNYAALIPAPDDVDEWNKTHQFIIDFSKWENSLNPTLIEKAREDILKANGGKPPKVLDPFGGGGAIKQVKEELKKHLNEKLHRLWEEGVSGADFFIAAIGSAIEVFGKYEKVMDDEGNIVRADRLLDDVRRIATDYAVHQILHNGFAGEISDLTPFYVPYRWNYGEAKVQFDEARKLAQSCSIDLAKEWSRQGFIKKDKEFISVLGPQDRKIEDFKNSSELIDVLHSILLLWEKSKRDEMVNLLQDSGYGKGEAFYRVAQAVSETLPIESKEKKLLDGFLAGRERLRDEIRKEQVQRRLGE